MKTPSEQFMVDLYGLCDKDDACERGSDHAGECGVKPAPDCRLVHPHYGACQR